MCSPALPPHILKDKLCLPGAEAFLIHARVTEKLLPVSDPFHSSVGPQVPILKAAVQITPRTRLHVKDAY